ACGAAEQNRQDHGRLHGQRRRHRDAQNHRRPHEDCRASAGALRGAVRHADGRPVLEGQEDWRPFTEARDRSLAMGLMERVSTLLRANLNDLIDKAEDPSKMIKQVILDMEDQLLQVKTQVAISIADQHMLEKKQKESDVKAVEWMRKAELAVDRGQDDLARAALERHKSCERTAQSFREQVADQHAQVDMLKAVLGKLE